MKMDSKRAELLMLSVSLAWGASYLLMKVGLTGIGPFNLIALRFGLAFICMSLIFWPRLRALSPAILKNGLIMGTLLFLIFAFVIYGVKHTTASMAGFLASTTVILVPILESLLKRRLPDQNIALCIVLAAVGLYLLTVTDQLTFDKNCVYGLAGALAYAAYIIMFDRIAKQEDTLPVSTIQFGVASVLGLLFALCFETPALPQTPLQWGAIAGLGIICSAFGFAGQALAQRYLPAEKIGLIFALEPVFSALLSYIFLREMLSVKGYIGAAFVLSGVVLSQILKPKEGGKAPLQLS